MKKSNFILPKVLTTSVITGSLLLTPFITKPVDVTAKKVTGNVIKNNLSITTLSLLGITAASTIGFGFTLNHFINEKNKEKNNTTNDNSKTPEVKPQNGFYFNK